LSTSPASFGIAPLSPASVATPPRRSSTVGLLPPLSASRPDRTPVSGFSPTSANTDSSAARSLPSIVTVGAPVMDPPYSPERIVAAPITFPPTKAMLDREDV